MATQWYWRDGDAEQGPVSFPDLTEKIRDHSLNEDDLGVGVLVVGHELEHAGVPAIPPQDPQEQQMRFFPVIGACHAEDFWMMLSMCAIVLGLGAYLMAVHMERRFLEME